MSILSHMQMEFSRRQKARTSAQRMQWNIVHRDNVIENPEHPSPAKRAVTDDSSPPSYPLLHELVAINPDGTLAPLSLIQRIYYGSAFDKLVHKLERVHYEAEQLENKLSTHSLTHVLTHSLTHSILLTHSRTITHSLTHLRTHSLICFLGKFDVLDLRDKEYALLQHFVLTNCSDTSRLVVSTLMFERPDTIPNKIEPLSWCLAVFVLFGSILYFLYFIFMWGVQNKGLTLQNWCINAAVSFGQVCCLTHSLTHSLTHRHPLTYSFTHSLTH